MGCHWVSQPYSRADPIPRPIRLGIFFLSFGLLFVFISICFVLKEHIVGQVERWNWNKLQEENKYNKNILCEK